MFIIALMHYVPDKNKILIVGIVTSYGICNLVGFPLMIEQIAKRIGKQYLVMGTGLVFFLSQGFTSLSAYIVGLITDSQTKMSTMWALVVPIIVALLGIAFSVYAEIHIKKNFSKLTKLTSEKLNS